MLKYKIRPLACPPEMLKYKIRPPNLEMIPADLDLDKTRWLRRL
jgi:hypothetical protein